MDSSQRNFQTLEGKVAIVTGASRGLGAGFAFELARRGAKTSESPTARKRSPSKLPALFGPHIDIVVNNAGAELVKRHTGITPADFDYIYHLNVRAPLLLLQAIKPYLPPSGGGRIINISSVGARYGFKDLSLYCSSKAALEGMTRCWAAELGEDGHTVNAVNPGPVQSDMLDNIPQDIITMQKAQTPAGNRLGSVDDVAQIVAWLASEE
ncbi:hypothetical protein CEP52_004326, partial [Fusarium oligoseptatum]